LVAARLRARRLRLARPRAATTARDHGAGACCAAPAQPRSRSSLSLAALQLPVFPFKVNGGKKKKTIICKNKWTRTIHLLWRVFKKYRKKEK
jgi:hypothetical protein